LRQSITLYKNLGGLEQNLGGLEPLSPIASAATVEIPVSCRVACLPIVSLAFISVVLLLSTVTNDLRYLNFFTFYRAMQFFVQTN